MKGLGLGWDEHLRGGSRKHRSLGWERNGNSAPGTVRKPSWERKQVMGDLTKSVGLFSVHWEPVKDFKQGVDVIWLASQKHNSVLGREWGERETEQKPEDRWGDYHWGPGSSDGPFPHGSGSKGNRSGLNIKDLVGFAVLVMNGRKRMSEGRNQGRLFLLKQLDNYWCSGDEAEASSRKIKSLNLAVKSWMLVRRLWEPRFLVLSSS